MLILSFYTLKFKNFFNIHLEQALSPRKLERCRLDFSNRWNRRGSLCRRNILWWTSRSHKLSKRPLYAFRMWIYTAAVPMTTTELYDLNWPINTENQQIIKSINSGQNLLAGRQTVLSDRSYVMRVSFKFHWFGACPRIPDANTILRRTTGQHGALTIHSQTIHRVFAITYSYSSIYFVLFLKQKNF